MCRARQLQASTGSDASLRAQGSLSKHKNKCSSALMVQLKMRSLLGKEEAAAAPRQLPDWPSDSSAAGNRTLLDSQTTHATDTSASPSSSGDQNSPLCQQQLQTQLQVLQVLQDQEQQQRQQRRHSLQGQSPNPAAAICRWSQPPAEMAWERQQQQQPRHQRAVPPSSQCKDVEHQLLEEITCSCKPSQLRRLHHHQHQHHQQHARQHSQTQQQQNRHSLMQPSQQQEQQQHEQQPQLLAAMLQRKRARQAALKLEQLAWQQGVKQQPQQALLIRQRPSHPQQQQQQTVQRVQPDCFAEQQRHAQAPTMRGQQQQPHQPRLQGMQFAPQLPAAAAATAAAAPSLTEVSMQVKQLLQVAETRTSPVLASQLRQHLLSQVRAAGEAARASGQMFSVTSALQQMLPGLKRDVETAILFGPPSTIMKPAAAGAAGQEGTRCPSPAANSSSFSSSCAAAAGPAGTMLLPPPVTQAAAATAAGGATWEISSHSSAMPNDQPGLSSGNTGGLSGQQQTLAAATVVAGTNSALLAAAALETALSAAAYEARLYYMQPSVAAGRSGQVLTAAGAAAAAEAESSGAVMALDVDLVLQSELASVFSTQCR